MYDTTSLIDDAVIGAATGAVVGSTIVSMIVTILVLVAMWKVFTKAGKPGWACLIPIYNLVCLFQIAGMNPWLILAELVPIVNVIVLVMLYLNIAKKFGKGTGFAIGLILLNPIFMLILGFSDATYIEEAKD